MRRQNSLRPAYINGVTTFSKAVRPGSRLNCWNTKPMLAPRTLALVLLRSFLHGGSVEDHLAAAGHIEQAQNVQQGGLAAAGAAHDCRVVAQPEPAGPRRGECEALVVGQHHGAGDIAQVHQGRVAGVVARLAPAPAWVTPSGGAVWSLSSSWPKMLVMLSRPSGRSRPSGPSGIDSVRARHKFQHLFAFVQARAISTLSPSLRPSTTLRSCGAPRHPPREPRPRRFARCP